MARSPVIFTDASGRRLTLAALRRGAGQHRWEPVGARRVPARALALHQQARRLGAAGDYAAALPLLGQAAAAAPRWPYPPYDRAFALLLMGRAEAALAAYEQVERLAPDGFYTLATALWALRGERDGRFPPGTYRAFVGIESAPDRAAKQALAESLVRRLPRYAPGWKELAALRDDPAARQVAIDAGLAADPDRETRGILLLNQAVLLQAVSRPAAIELLGGLILDPASSPASVALAKTLLTLILAEPAEPG